MKISKDNLSSEYQILSLLFLYLVWMVLNVVFQTYAEAIYVPKYVYDFFNINFQIIYGWNDMVPWIFL